MRAAGLFVLQPQLATPQIGPPHFVWPRFFLFLTQVVAATNFGVISLPKLWRRKSPPQSKACRS
jgi:hypothetical protein